MAEHRAGSAAIVVLGCRVPGPAAGKGAAVRRAKAAAAAFGDVGASLVVTSGGRRWGDLTEADFLADVVHGEGVPRRSIARELCSLSTMENAWYSRDVLQSAGADRAYVVTCDWHMARALFCFARVGVEAYPLPVTSGKAGSLAGAAREFVESARRIVEFRALGRWTDP
jgi:uncharacterized SAM-binding protein YcdF (DUF218 family)